MKPVVIAIPGPLRELAGSRDEVRIEAAVTTLGEALAHLWRECPAVRDRVLTDQGDLRPHVNIFVDGENARHAGGLETPVHEGTEILILPAVSGG